MNVCTLGRDRLTLTPTRHDMTGRDYHVPSAEIIDSQSERIVLVISVDVVSFLQQ